MLACPTLFSSLLVCWLHGRLFFVCVRAGQARIHRFASTGAASVLAVAVVLFLTSGPSDPSSAAVAKTQGLSSLPRTTQLEVLKAACSSCRSSKISWRIRCHQKFVLRPASTVSMHLIAFRCAAGIYKALAPCGAGLQILNTVL